MTEIPDQNPVVWHVFLCFAFPGNRRSPPQPLAQPPDDPADNLRTAIELDRHHQPAWVPLHLISRFSSRRCHWLRWGSRTARNTALPLRPYRHRAGRRKISGRTRRLVRLAVAAGSAGRVFADHANRIFPKREQTVWGRTQHNRTRHSGHNLLVQFVCMKGNAPNINHIVLADLTDNDRLVELYRQAVQRRIWCDNSERDFIEFVNRAMKALHANSQEHPALLFHWLINHPSYGDIPQMCEKITFARFNSQSRQNALALARRSSVAQADAQLRDQARKYRFIGLHICPNCMRNIVRFHRISLRTANAVGQFAHLRKEL